MYNSGDVVILVKSQGEMGVEGKVQPAKLRGKGVYIHERRRGGGKITEHQDPARITFRSLPVRLDPHFNLRGKEQ